MIHLHTRSSYSLLHSPIRLEELIQKAKQENKKAIALTDLSVMFGTMEWIKRCKESNIKPIIGLEITLKEPEFMNFVLLAKNNRGLKNLFKISSEASKQTLTLAQIKPYFEDLFILYGHEDGILYQSYQESKEEFIAEHLSALKKEIPDLYLSLVCNDSKYHKRLNEIFKKTAQLLNIPTVACSRIYYLKQEDVEDLKVLRAIEKQTTLNDGTLNVSYGRYWRTDQEMEQLYDQDDLDQSDWIASQCNVDFEHLEKSDLPIYKNRLGIDSRSYLIKLCKAGLKKRMNDHIPKIYIDRLEYELSVITKMGFTNYFLIVYDMIRYAKTQNILVGPGRGSAAGSLVAYCLGITHIDPIKNQLLFERFLNPERISMPDIDTDFPDTSRHKIIEYLQAQYGADHVALIVTFSALKAKQALRDVARVKNIPNLEIDLIVRLIPNVPNMNLNRAWNEISAFRSKIQSKASYLDLFHTALKIENLPRHTSQHAAGVVLSQKEIVEVCPIYAGDGTIQSTQFTMDYLESLGLIKMDVLALKNLTTVENILSDLKKTYGLELDIYKLNRNDKKTYALLSSGDTIGVFQFESDGIRSLLRDIRPQTFSDIAIALALYRPGPMENKNVYLANRNHPETIHYLHPLLEPILKETYGIMIYQEQIMQIAQTIGNMTLAQADSLRKAMSKKNKALMDSYEEIFIQGATAQNINKEIATKIFKTMEHFADYGFNKSHSYAYASLAYAMAYLKANYPLFFYRSLLDSVTGNKEKSADYIFECSKRNVPVLPCSIVSSTDRYCIENNGIRMPFQVLKGIGKTVYDKIIQERNKKPFQDLYECMARLIACGIKENALITLINAGAFDPLYPSRKTLAENLDQIISYANLVKVEDETLHFDFSVASPPNLIRLEEQALERAQKEKEVYGFYLSEHPISSLRKKRFQNLRTLREISEQLGFVSVLGRVSRIKPYRTKKGDLMAFLTLEDETQMIDVAIMPRLYGQLKGSLQENQIILLNGKKDRKDSVLAQKIQILSFDL